MSRELPARGTASPINTNEIEVLKAAIVNLTVAISNTKLADVKKDLEKTLAVLGDSKTKKALKNINNMFKNMIKGSISSTVIEKVFGLFEPFLEIVELLLIPLEALTGVIQIALIPLITALVPHLVSMSQWILENRESIILFIAALGGSLIIISLLIKNWDLVVDGVNSLIVTLNKLIKVFKPVEDAITGFGTFLVDNLNSIIKAFKPVTDSIITFNTFIINTFNGLSTFFTTTFVNKINNFIKLIKDGLRVIDKIWNNTGGKVFGTKGSLATGFKNAMKALKNIINSVLINPIRSAISSINKLPGVSVTKPPRLAVGAITTGPTLAQIGDNPSGKEMVLPLEKAEQMGFGGGNTQLLESIDSSLQIVVRNTKSRGLQRGRWG